MADFQINYLAVIVAALVTFAIGALWYSPMLFGNHWMKAQGWDESEAVRLKQSAGPAYGVSLVCYLVMAVALSLLIARLGLGSVESAVKLGLLVGLGFFATVGLTAHMFSERRFSLYLIDTGYQVIYVLVMTFILTLWR